MVRPEGAGPRGGGTPPHAGWSPVANGRITLLRRPSLARDPSRPTTPSSTKIRRTEFSRGRCTRPTKPHHPTRKAAVPPTDSAEEPYIRDELEARGWTQEDLAAILGRPLSAVNQIIKGNKAITPQTARELAAAFGTSAELWLNLENAYRLGLSRQETAEVSKRARLYELAPLKEMIRRGWIPPHEDADDLELAVLAFFVPTS